MGSASGVSATPTRKRRREGQPWYSRAGVPLAAALAATAGLVSLVIGVVMLSGHSGTRDDVSAIDAEAADVEERTADLRNEAAELRGRITTLPDVMTELDRGTADFLAAVESQAQLWNSLGDCLTSAPDVVPDPELAACFEEHLDAFEAGTRAETGAVERLRDGLDQAEEAVEVADDARGQ
ncbi:hypothetical protein EF847_10745 [Actinobacteria bacterium YIM 96077]|uniref:Uncharacterized protein n=1 Tax=Phytoactinopolyspora halophila TaxID=1981511 RepID=A0A329QKS4_9ACTN|nr:hypothetical protein [Phytoactinopolyspora halophila]AYY13106.1 hypothetical protein EF847_10745 [Actinobacteria bacterium YIM 96077]RAW11118.1 hypothetical protein DPM12_17390 [Phytoactinopolyspora halophila]